MQGELPYVHNILRYCFYKFTISVSVENLLGKGGHAEVYKGYYAHTLDVAGGKKDHATIICRDAKL